MIIDCISDLHGFYPKLEGGDLLIVAGDLTARDSYDELDYFERWLKIQNYKSKIIIAGNHDGYIERNPDWLIGSEFIYLCDSSTNFSYFIDGFPQEDEKFLPTGHRTLKIWGSPWTPTFCNWHFMLDRGAPIKAKWDLIPDDIDILITHGPPYSILDKVDISSRGDKHKHAGCTDLMNRIPKLKNLKLHVFGHIHEGYGHEVINGTHFVNASHVNEAYEPVNKPIRIEL